jgi:hypothetical protein|tara:strand:+ start:252 stop:542 length:291 start_codon:yes stop_codon:yes gene_type:complete
MPNDQIKNINGGWTALFKIILVISCAWVPWVTISIAKIQSECWTIHKHVEYDKTIQSRFREYPSKSIIARISTIEKDVTQIKISVARIDQKLEGRQ